MTVVVVGGLNWIIVLACVCTVRGCVRVKKTKELEQKLAASQREVLALRSQLRAAHLKILLQADELQRRTQLERQHWHPRTLSPSVRDFLFH